MKNQKLKRILKILLISADVLALPSVFLFRWLSSLMLSRETICMWLRFGFKCATCGGTHFVNSLASGNIAAAFNHNQYLFCLLIFFIISAVLLNLAFLFDLKFAKKTLRFLYNIPALIIHIVIFFGFVIVRNIPAMIHLINFLIDKY